ncbi:hypothetical protein [Aureimonas populi]|uniref:Uncharacterized protein n=1 Tax=Aureimonas populi TaxID=1701758 RepID=A0ABW5CL89_9HYPH|nr:hypothetical protein [Aureimonas populi]
MARRYDYSQVAGIRNPALRAIAAMAIVALPVLGALAFFALLALAYTIGR